MPEIGVISDTHGLLRPEALKALAGASQIIHAGDVGNPEILDALRTLAPVTAVRGNIDRESWAKALPVYEALEIDGVSLYVIHNIQEMDLSPDKAGFRVVISGHSHHPSIEERSGVLYLNPGSAGPSRFRLPVCLAKLSIRDGLIEPSLITLIE
jgi:uncharacterized protein